MDSNLKKERIKKGFTLQQVADKLNISRSAMSLYENEKRELNKNMILKLSKLYGVTVDYLLGNENLPQKTSGALETVTPEKAKEIWFASLPSATQILINQILQLDDFQKVRVSTFAMTLLAGGQ